VSASELSLELKRLYPIFKNLQVMVRTVRRMAFIMISEVIANWQVRRISAEVEARRQPTSERSRLLSVSPR
jgi:hypothetical protein